MRRDNDTSPLLIIEKNSKFLKKIGVKDVSAAETCTSGSNNHVAHFAANISFSLYMKAN